MINDLPGWSLGIIAGCLSTGVSHYFTYILPLHFHISDEADKELGKYILFILYWKPIHVGNSLGKEDGSRGWGSGFLWSRARWTTAEAGSWIEFDEEDTTLDVQKKVMVKELVSL